MSYTPNPVWQDGVSDITAAKLQKYDDTLGLHDATFGNKANLNHTHGVPDLVATGTKGATTFLRGDNTWAAPTPSVTDLTATGTRSATTFLRGDNTWAAPAYDNALPLAGLRTEKLRLARQENVAVGTNAEVTLASVSGPGYLASIWMAVPGGPPALDGRLRIYYDGSATASFDVDLGCLLATHFTPNGAFGVAHLGVEMGTSGSAQDTDFHFRFPVPFGTSVRVAFFNPSSTGITTHVFSQVSYRLTSTDLGGGRRLYSTGARFADQAVSVTAGATSTLASITGTPGSLVYLALVGGYQATNASWLERNIAIGVDGESTGTAAIQSTGTEDFFDSGWYYGNRSAYTINETSMVGVNKTAASPNQYVVAQATDMWEKWGGVPFTSSATITYLTESAVTTGHTQAWCVLYYRG